MGVFGRKPVIGSLDGNTFTGRKRIGYRNSFQTVIEATLTEDGTGTRIDCRFRMSLAVVVFMVIWFGFLLIIGCVGLVKALSAILFGSPALRARMPGCSFCGLAFPVAVPMIMAVFGFFVLQVGRWIARSERPYLIQFFCNTLNARVVADAAATAARP